MRQRTGCVVLGGALFGLVSACNSLDEPTEQTGSRVIVPVDARAAQQALTKLPAISGGTLAASLDSRFAVAADPDRDRVSIINLATHEVRHIMFEAGDEPGRVTTDATGRAYVALRRVGDVVSIDLASGEIDKRTHVCSAPRGMAVDGSVGLLHVACADGRLVTLNAAQGEIVRSLPFDAELRDVMVSGDRLLVSTFKSAELLNVDAMGQIASRASANEFVVTKPFVDNGSNDFGSVMAPPELQVQGMRPHVAWRTAQTQTGEVVMLHQGASEGEVDIQHKADVASSPYGGGGGCSGIVVPAVTVIDAQNVSHTMAINTGVLSVDMALSASGDAAIVQAGGIDVQAPRPTTVFDNDGASFGAGSPVPVSLAGGSPFGPFLGQAPVPEGIDIEQVGTSSVTILSRPAMMAAINVDKNPGCVGGGAISVVGQATAVAFTPSGDMIVQSREPGLITWVSRSVVSGNLVNPGLGNPAQQPGATQLVTIELGGASVRDTGHEIFHRDAGGGIACASCHAEGAEDGHTWTFVKLGLRRTQALHIGLEGTAPFHWSGDESDMGRLMEDVFVGRMGGVHQSSDRLNSLTHWLFALQPPAPIVDAASDAAVRGKELFESAATGCTTCHAGAKFTNNQNADVGTGGKLQVPSLLGVGYRAPLMHTGCAATLQDRFDPACGGRAHGRVEQLKPTQIDDMVAFLRTL